MYQKSAAWAIPHIEAGFGAIPVARPDREDVAEWIDALASGGRLSRRSVQICRTVLRAALAEAGEEGLIPRSPAARVGLPRTVAKPAKPKEIQAWETDAVSRFLEACRDHRWAVGFRLGVLYGLRRSEVLALRWDDVDETAMTLRVDQGLVAVSKGAAWSDAKNERSRRHIPLDDGTFRTLSRRRAE
jgi:integrase